VADRRCKRIFAALSAYLDGELPAKNCHDLEKHFKDCKPCLAYLATLKTSILACRQYSAPQAPPPSPRVRAAMLKALLDSRQR
jgi:anti-sigma factor RsiW